MRPPTRTTRSARSADPQEPSVHPSANKSLSRASSNRSSRTGTPYSDKDKKPRHRMTDLQLERLEALYQQDTHPTREQKQALGDSVGMDARTVTVWFQNRRQLSKKNSLIVADAPLLMSRRPLASVGHRNALGPSRPPSVASSVSGSSSLCDYPASGHVKRELWEYLPSSPSASSLPVSAVTSAMSSPRSKRFAVIRGSGKENAGVANLKRKPILEWACARAAKRPRADRLEDLDEEVDILGEDYGDDSESTIVDLELPKEAKKLSASASLPAVAIPKEYEAKFSPDVVLGASLLLTFQYSTKS